MNIIYFNQLNSTNKYAKQNIDSLEDKTIISADIQTNGCGRFERPWMDLGTENIYISFVLKPSDKVSNVHANLTQYLSVVLCKQLEEMKLPVKIKWPNDVLINNKKVCGILAETVIKNNELKGIILGIGVNLNTDKQSLEKIDQPAASLNLELGYKINKQDFMEKLIKSFFANYDSFLQKGFSCIKKDYEERSLLSKDTDNVEIAVFDLVKTGKFTGFDDNGNLLLLIQNARVETINTGEIIQVVKFRVTYKK